MKRIFSLLMVLALLAALSVLAEAQPEPLKAAELTAFAQGLIDRALREGAGVEATDDGYVAEGEGYALYLTSKDLSQDSVLSGASLGMDALHADGLVGPRGIGVTATLQEVLAAYPNDNPVLAGTMNGAVLYVSGTLPGPVQVGQLTRDGQAISLIEYSVYEPAGEGFMRLGLQYTLDNDAVIAIRFFGGGEVLSQEEARANLEAAVSLQEESGYFAFDTWSPGMLAREDLSVAGLDFLDLTPEAAVSSLGEVVHEEKVKDSTGEELRLMQWDGIEVSFVYGADGSFRGTDRISVTVPGIDGPRGLRVGTRLSAALSRFQHDEALTGLTQTLYGQADQQLAPYGLLIVQGQEAQLYYALKLEERSILFSCQFIDEVLVEMSLTH
ncbi:MAG: hypothetical protein AB9880_07165 [Christensenellales bacterium]